MHDTFQHEAKSHASLLVELWTDQHVAHGNSASQIAVQSRRHPHDAWPHLIICLLGKFLLRVEMRNVPLYSADEQAFLSANSSSCTCCKLKEALIGTSVSLNT